MDDNVVQTCTHSQSDPRLSLPSSRSVIQVLYPPSYLGIRSPFPDPPPYPVQGDDPEISPLMPSSTAGIQGTHGRQDPLAEDPSLTGVPTQGSSVPLIEPNPPTTDLGAHLEDTEPLPAYSRIGQHRPRFPVASDVLGPYPPLSVLCQVPRRR